MCHMAPRYGFRLRGNDKVCLTCVVQRDSIQVYTHRIVSRTELNVLNLGVQNVEGLLCNLLLTYFAHIANGGIGRQAVTSSRNSNRANLAGCCLILGHPYRYFQ